MKKNAVTSTFKVERRDIGGRMKKLRTGQGRDRIFTEKFQGPSSNYNT